VTNPDGQSGTLSAGFTYTAPPTLSSVTPAVGPTAGGTAVTISGTNFVSGATVTFDGLSAIAVTVTSSTTITATTPAHPTGLVTVTVTNPNGQNASRTNGFEYLPVPAITAVSPTSGPTFGGTAVTITGTGLRFASSVTFGGTAATFTVVSDTRINATAPRRSTGTVNIVVTTPGGTSAVSASSQFTYIVPRSSVRFDGVNDYVRVPNSSTLRIPNNMTLEAWIKPSGPFTGHRHVAGKNYYQLSIVPSGTGYRVTWEIRVNRTWRTLTSPQLAYGQWMHVAGVYGGGSMRLFVNGTQVATLSLSGNIDQNNSSNSVFRIGAATGSSDYFPGHIDEVRVSNIVRYTATFTVPAAPFNPDANTNGLWHLSEGTGTTTVDESGKNNNGTLTNGPVWAIDTPFP
jgi:hypothetical protein